MTGPDEAAWVCAFCGAATDDDGGLAGVCYARLCACGAVAFAAPQRDADEVIDEAVNYFGVATSGWAEGRPDDLARDGVVTRRGHFPGPPPVRGAWLCLWFHRGG